jgi:hypothetical protein
MVVQISIKNPDGLKDGDILIFKGGKFDKITKDELLKDVLKELQSLKQKYEHLEGFTEKMMQSINNKQKSFIQAFMKEL